MRKPLTFFFPLLLLYLAVLLSMTSCVSKKKFLAEVSTRTACDSTLQIINSHNLDLNQEIGSLNLQLAEKTGEANGLRDIYDRQDQKIEGLQAEIRGLKSQSVNQQEVLDGALERKSQELADKNAIIQGFKGEVQTQEQQLSELVGKIANNLNEYSSEDISLEVKDRIGYIRLSEKILFRSSTRLSTKAYDILDSIATVVMQYPQMDITILGHTDNRPVKRKGLKDNWDLSVLRATPVARMLIEEFGLNPNQVTAGGKGDSKPRTANDSAKGREQNRRTEIIIYPPTDNLIKMIKRE